MNDPDWYTNVKDADLGDVFCGRSHGDVPAPPQKGWLGNPVKLGENCPICGDSHDIPGSTLDCYEEYLSVRLEEDKHFRRQFKKTARRVLEEGVRLICYCRDNDRCHTSVIYKYLQEYKP